MIHKTIDDPIDDPIEIEYEAGFIAFKKYFVAIAKIEAFKFLYPERYEKIVEDLNQDIEQMVQTHHEMEKEGVYQWH